MNDYKGNTIVFKDGKVGQIYFCSEKSLYISLDNSIEKRILNEDDVIWHGSEGYEK